MGNLSSTTVATSTTVGTKYRAKIDDPNSPYVDFYGITRSQLIDCIQFFYLRYDFNNHLLSYSQFEDIFWRFYDNPDRQRKAFNMLSLLDEHGTAMVSAMDIFAVSYLLGCERTRVSISDKFDWIMAFFQFQSPLDQVDDHGIALKYPVRPTDKVRKDDVSLFLETTCVAFCRLAGRELLDSLVIMNIVDSIFSEGESNKGWLEVKEQLLCNNEVIDFLQNFHEVYNWMDLCREFAKLYETLERRFTNAEHIQKIRAAEQDAEQERLDKESEKLSKENGGTSTGRRVVPPNGLKSSKTMVVKNGIKNMLSSMRGKNQKNETEKDDQKGQRSSYKGGLPVNQCVDMLADTLASVSSMKPLGNKEVEALRYILDAVSENQWVNKNTFDTAASSILSFTLLDQLHHRNKLYEGSIIELRELCSRRFMDVSTRSIFFNTHFDNSSDAQEAMLYYIPPKQLAPTNNQDHHNNLQRTSCDNRNNEIFIRSLDLQLPTDLVCPRKGKELFGTRECFFVTRIGWVEFQCGVFERCGAERVLLKTFQHLDNESRGAISSENVEALIRDRLGSHVILQIQRQLSPSSQEIVNENIRHISKAFAVLTADEVHGESTWDNVSYTLILFHSILHDPI